MGFESNLQSKLFRAGCPPTEQLGEFHLGLLDPQSEKVIRYHLALCHLCQADINALGMFLEEVADTIDYRDLHTPKPATLRKWIAELGRKMQGSEAARNPAPAFRGTEETSKPKPQHYYVGDTQIMLDIQSDLTKANLFQLIGTVMSDMDQFETAQLLKDETVVQDVSVDDLGNFEFNLLESDRYAIVIKGLENQITIPTVSI